MHRAARHSTLVEEMSAYLPRQVLIDEYWINLRRSSPGNLNSHDAGYHFGNVDANHNWELNERLFTLFASRIAGLANDTAHYLTAFEYPWAEVWGRGHVVSRSIYLMSRSTVGRSLLDLAVSSGGVPLRARRHSRNLAR